jgi:hypothetical protein
MFRMPSAQVLADVTRTMSVEQIQHFWALLIAQKKD